MKLNDMIFVIENRKGTVETNFLLTLDDTIEMLKQSGEYSLKETAAIFSELGRTMTEPDWAEVYLSGNTTLNMCYSRVKNLCFLFLTGVSMKRKPVKSVLIMTDAAFHVRRS